MKITNNYTLGFKRKRKGLTDYRKRLKTLMSKKPRLVVRKSLKYVQATIAEFDEKGDKIKVAAHSSNLKKLGWNHGTCNIPAAYLVGYMLGKKAKAANIEEAVFDIGQQKVLGKSKLFAVLAGACDAGLTVPHSEEMLPSEDRIKGTHIQTYATKLKENNDAYQKQFGQVLKNGNPEDISKQFDEVKKKIDAQ